MIISFATPTGVLLRSWRRFAVWYPSTKTGSSPPPPADRHLTTQAAAPTERTIVLSMHMPAHRMSIVALAHAMARSVAALLVAVQGLGCALHAGRNASNNCMRSECEWACRPSRHPDDYEKACSAQSTTIESTNGAVRTRPNTTTRTG